MLEINTEKYVKTIVLHLGKINSQKKISKIPRITIKGKLRQLEKVYGQHELASIFGVNPRTIRKWKSGETKPRNKYKDRNGNYHNFINQINIRYENTKEKAIGVRTFSGIVINKNEVLRKIIESSYNSEFANSVERSIKGLYYDKCQLFVVAQSRNHTGGWHKISFIPTIAFTLTNPSTHKKFNTFSEMINDVWGQNIMLQLNQSPTKQIRLYRFGVILYANKEILR